MTNGTLDKDLISNPDMWNLLLRLSPSELHVVAYSIIEDNSLIYRRFPLENNPDSYLRSLEETIYDNPMLLGDFRRVYCVIQTSTHIVVPAEYTSDNDRETLLTASHPDFKGSIFTDTTGCRNAIIIAGIENYLSAFLHRTFHNVAISSHLSPLCCFFSAKAGKSNNIKTLVNLRESSLDIIIMQGGNLMLANTFSFSDPMDAVYYILACRNRIGLDPHNDELLLSGDASVREKILPMLRTYLARVMPMIFPPQMFKSGKDAMIAPFDLIVTPICE